MPQSIYSFILNESCHKPSFFLGIFILTALQDSYITVKALAISLKHGQIKIAVRSGH